MSEIMNALKKYGQTTESALAERCKTSRKVVNQVLYPHVASGEVMSCAVRRGSEKDIEYRIGGTVPVCRPGPKIRAKTS